MIGYTVFDRDKMTQDINTISADVYTDLEQTNKTDYRKAWLVVQQENHKDIIRWKHKYFSISFHIYLATFALKKLLT